MDGKSAVAFATLALLAAGLSGCVAPGMLWDPNDGEATALQHRAAVDAAAQSWAPGAALVSIFSLEAAADNEPIPADPTPGNGHAPVWYYAYVSPAGEPRAFRVLADGRVFLENDTYGAEQYTSHSTPLGELALDSDAALAVANADATFAAALAGAELTLAEGVARWDGIDGWYFAAISEGGSAIAVVDAATGALVMVSPFDLDMDMDFSPLAKSGFAFTPPEPLRLEGEGVISRAQPGAKMAAEFPFEWTGVPAGFATLDLTVRKETGAESVTWRILDEEGETVESGRLSRPLARSEAGSWDFELDPGAYTLLVGLGGAPLPVGSAVFEFVLEVSSVPPQPRSA